MKRITNIIIALALLACVLPMSFAETGLSADAVAKLKARIKAGIQNIQLTTATFPELAPYVNGKVEGLQQTLQNIEQLQAAELGQRSAYEAPAAIPPAPVAVPPPVLPPPPVTCEKPTVYVPAYVQLPPEVEARINRLN